MRADTHPFFAGARETFSSDRNRPLGESRLATDQAASGVGGPERELLVEWIRTAKKGDIGSYQKIYDAFAPKVLNFIYRMLNSVEEAEDLLIRAVDRGLVIRNRELGAVGAHDLVGAADVAARHGRKEMMLDLVVERSI